MGEAQQGRPGAAAAVEFLSADAILANDDLQESVMDIPEWGGKIRVRGLSVHDVNESNRLSLVAGEVDPEKVTCMTVVFGCVEPKFTPEQAGALARKSASVLNRIGAEIFRLSGVGERTPLQTEARFREGAS